MKPTSKKTRANGGLCARCGAQRPPGRTTYCSDECWTISNTEREKKRQAKRRTACQRCGGDKGPSPRGGRYCPECRRVMQDQSAAYVAERNRQYHEKRRAEKVDRGDLRRNYRVREGYKWCARCQSELPQSSFGKSGSRLQAYCIPCTRAYNAIRHRQLKFGISWEDYDAMFAGQGGRCAICHGKPRKHLLAVDHDHKTGAVRGLLCSRCNHRLLGAARDSLEVLNRAVAYLEAPPADEHLGRRHIIPGHEDEGAE